MIEPFAQRTIDVARGFLRSAVVVDDEPFITPRSQAPPAAEEVDPTIEEIPIVEKPVGTEEDGEEAGQLDVGAVVRSFAKIGIICAVIKPAEADDPPDAAVTTAAAASDLVVLDWELYRDDGARALELIRALATRPGRGWIVLAIYTKSERLDQIAERVEGVVREACGSAGRDGLTVRASGIAVQVMAKPTAERTERGEGPAAITPEQLPYRMVEVFADAAGGLLSNAALRGLTALREGALVVLRAFDREIDPGFVAHRLLLQRPTDAEDQAIALLAAEFGALLESAGIEGEVASSAISEWLSQRGIRSDSEIPAALWDRVFTPSAGSGRFEAVAGALENGIAKTTVGGRELKLKAGGFKSAAALFSSTQEAGHASNTRFAHLMSVESRYRADSPGLGLGTILDGDGRVWISLQPACDSVRLTSSAGFPLVPLREVTNADQFALVVVDGSPRYFTPPTKFREVEVRAFSPDPTRQEVAAADDGGTWTFSDQGGRKYRWLGTLREQHAQRLAKRFADRLSRLGLEESEWLRLSAPKWADEG